MAQSWKPGDPIPYKTIYLPPGASFTPLILPGGHVIPDPVDKSWESPFSAGLIAAYSNSDLIGHDGRCGPVWRPLRAWFGLSVWKFKGCNRDFGMGGFCERRYVWDQGRWVRLLSPRQIAQLEKELREPLDSSGTA